MVAANVTQAGAPACSQRWHHASHRYCCRRNARVMLQQCTHMHVMGSECKLLNGCYKLGMHSGVRFCSNVEQGAASDVHQMRGTDRHILKAPAKW